MCGGDSEAEMNSLCIVCSVLQFVSFIHRVLVTWHFKEKVQECKATNEMIDK